MKKIVCELCESTEFAKEGGMFVCQGCGTKYTPDEAKAMMKEVEGGAAPTPVTGAPSVNPNQQQIDNLLVLASNAFEASNNQETEGYCNKIIEMDVTCYKAWLLKGQAIGWQSTYGSPRVTEGANAMRKAVDFAPEEEKETVAKQAVRALCRICTALASLAKDNFSNSPTEDNRFKFGEFLDLCDKVTDMFCNVSEDVKQFATDEYIECKRQCAEFMNLSGVAALNMVREKWNELDHPNKASWDTYIEWCGEVRMMFEDSIKWGKSVDEDYKEIVTRYKNLAIAWEEPINSCSWEQRWVSYASEYRWFVAYSLTDEAKSKRRKLAKEARDNAANLEKSEKEKKKKEEEAAKKAAEEAKKARIKAYWEAHKEEKDKLESEKKNLENKQKDINSQIAELDKQIKAAEAEEKAAVPSEAEESKLHEQVRELEARRSKLGLFAGKEKKQIAEEIAALEGRISAVKTKVQEEKKAKSDEVKAKVAPLKTKKDELNKELPAIKKRISAIDAELTKDPEE